MQELFGLNYWKNAFTSSPTRKRLTENFFSLSFLQAANYILPLITLPYLVRVLGAEKFGLIAFAQAFIMYFIILTDYGFNLSATREISINRESKEKVSEIFSSVMIVKFGLMIVSFLILTALVFAIPKFRNDWLLYFFTSGMVLGQVLFPTWFFQGMERMKYITFLNITAKLIFTISIFVFIRNVQDYIYVPLITSLGFLVAGILGLWIVYKDFKVKFILPSFKSMKHQLKEGWYIFISTMSYNLYNTCNIFFIGIFLNYSIVGYYSAAEKIIRAIRNLLNVIFNVFYPYLSKLAIKNREFYLKRWKQLFLTAFPIATALSLSVFLFSENITELVLSNKFYYSSYIMKFLSFSLILQVLMNLFGMQMMLVLGFLKVYGLSYAIISLFYFAASPFVIKNAGITGLLIFLLSTEFSIALFRFYYLRFRVKIPIVSLLLCTSPSLADTPKG